MPKFDRFRRFKRPMYVQEEEVPQEFKEWQGPIDLRDVIIPEERGWEPEPDEYQGRVSMPWSHDEWL